MKFLGFQIFIFVLLTFFSSGPSLAQDKSMTFLFTGDIMLDRNVYKKMSEKNDLTWPFKKIKPVFEKADFVFGNLETPLSNNGTKIEKKGIWFKAPESVIKSLTYAGIDAVSIANNHIFDYGKTALKDTLKILDQHAIKHVGANLSYDKTYQPLKLIARSTKIAIFAYTDTRFFSKWGLKPKNNFIAWMQNDRIWNDIKKAVHENDIVIITMHAGMSYSKKQDAIQTEFAKKCIDLGVQLVVGHHPHVIQPVEKYKQGYIAYSLGNFIFDQTRRKELMRGLMLKVKIDNNKIKKVIPIKTKITKNLQVTI